MNQVWGRAESRGWPSNLPVYTIWALVLSLASVFPIGCYRYAKVWTPLQRFYLRQYLLGGMSTKVGPKTCQYQLLTLVERKNILLALDDEVAPVRTVSGESTFELTKEARKRGATHLELRWGEYDNAEMHAFLGYWIYQDQTLKELARWPFFGGLGVFAVGLMLTAPKDAAQTRELRYGRRLKGPELVTGSMFNRRNRSRGIGFPNQERSIIEIICGTSRMVRVPRVRESSHFLIIGDTGAGKSALIRQMLIQIEDRGETAIVYDPEREYTPQFFSPARGDVILNPLDARMPYWSPGDEARSEPEALTLAASLFPNRPNEQRFFTRAPREILAHLLTYRPTPEELALWMSHDEEIDRRVRGTEMASVIAPTAPGQREGVMAELKMVSEGAETLAQRKRNEEAMEHPAVGEGTAGMAVPDQHENDA